MNCNYKLNKKTKMIIKLKIEEIVTVNCDEITIYDVHYMILQFKGNNSFSQIVSFSNMPSSDDILDNCPFKIPVKLNEPHPQIPYTTVIKERQIIKIIYSDSNPKYIYNYPHSDIPFVPGYYKVIEN